MSTLDPQITDYTLLITSEHRDKPHFLAVVTEATAQPAVDERTTELALPADFDLDLAVGVQLDQLGLWAGVSRVVTVVPSAAYPVPAQPYQASLDDDTYRRLIRARVLANRWDGTPEMAAEVLALFYGPAGQYAAILDNQDMSITLYLTSDTGHRQTAAEAAVLSQFLLPLRPSGVRVKDTWIPPEPGGPLFGLGVANEFINGPGFGCFGGPFV